MFNRFVILNLVLLVGFLCVLLIPDAPPIQPASIRMELPAELGAWEGAIIEPSEAELAVLSDDTEYCKRLYSRSEPTSLFDQLQAVNVGIVLSGNDVNNSIHRPERCLPSQGFKGLQLSTIDVPVAEGNLAVRRILSHRDLPLRDGGSLRLTNINYYWFVGHEHVTESHYDRTFLDMYDRLVSGYNQRWAYFTISSYVTSNIDTVVGRSEAETDELLLRFVSDVYQSSVAIDSPVASVSE